MTSVIDCACTCPTYYGRNNKKGNAVEMLRWQKENTIPYEQACGRYEEETRGKIILGLHYHYNRLEYCNEYQKLVDKCRKEEV